jgi:ketopantoate reductase
MSTLIVGAGAVGGYYGARRTPLLEAAAVALRVHNDRLAGSGTAGA